MPDHPVIRWLFGESGPEIIHECRNCGAKLEADADACPHCDGEQIAEYRFE